MKKLLSIALVTVLCAFLLAACGGEKPAESEGEPPADPGAQTETDAPADADAGDLAKITAAGKMVIGITNYEPMNYYDDKGELIGFDTEYTKAVCEKLGVEPEFIEIEWDNKEIELNAGNIDAIWNGMTYTAERDENMDFAKPYVKNDIVVVVQKANAGKYKTIADLAGLEIAAEDGSTGADAVENNPDLEASLQGVASLVDSLMEVNAGTADAASVDSTMAKELVGKDAYKDLVILPDIILSEEVLAIGFRTGSDLPAKIDEITAELVADGTLAALAEKYKVAFFYE
ncbi:MAG: transporter substrate-binding domain-containing protein [Clostridiales Family XIII bacterium]|nr:transporter substrate-binding domain-containing protein [Clostridiales Family XIII bacterium]